MNRTLTTEDVAFLVTDRKLDPAGLVEARERRPASRGGLARRYVLDTRHRLRSRRWEHLLKRERPSAGVKFWPGSATPGASVSVRARVRATAR